MFKQFDIVRIKTTKNVDWLSKPNGVDAIPHGNWSVIGSIGMYLLICKDLIMVKIPINDVEKIADYNLEKIFEEKKNG